MGFCGLALSLDGLCASAGPLTVVLRYDELSSTSSIEMDRAIVNGLDDIASSYTVAVVPHKQTMSDPSSFLPPSTAKIDLVRTRSRCEVALHGWTHEARRSRPLYHILPGRKTEFAGLGWTEQLTRIQQGRQTVRALSGKPVTTFAPPFNWYDQDTIRAVSKVGLEILSANVYGPQADGTVRFVPITCHPATLERAVALARKRGGA